MAKLEKPKPKVLPPYPNNSSSSAKIHPSNDPEADANSYSLEKFRLYETQQRFYLIGSDQNKRFFRVLKIDRSEPSDLNISEDPVVYSPHEINNLLQRIAEGNRATGGLNFVVKVYGIVGCIKFLESYYLLLVTKRRQIGCICGHAIYSIDDSQLITIPHVTIQTDVAHSKTELRYKKLLSSVDLTKDFFFSYTYPIMQSLQQNVLSMGEDGVLYENMFVWNAYLTQGIRERCGNTIWTIALVHGNFKQIRLSIFGRDFSVSLVSRRSRHFAGTRFLKRGLNDRGRVANDVETEQIVLDEEAGYCKGKMSSVVQMRGSIPLFWSQEASKLSPKPDIILQRCDPTYEATKLHFEDLARRYGNPIIVLNLIKTVEKRPREMILRREFANAVGYLNTILSEENHLKFIHWDFHKFAKSKSANVLAVLGAVASEALDLTGFYYSGKPPVNKKRTSQLSRTNTKRDSSLRDMRASSGDLARIGSSAESQNFIINQDMESNSNQETKHDKGGSHMPQFQSGVLRTNCIDCLDRTNVAQYAYGLAALGRQLHAMGLTDVPKVDPDSTMAVALMDMYQNMGDALAQQYGGSAAHNTVFTERQGKWKATTQSREFIKSIKRYYSNTYTDGEKQDAINLFLGYFQPQDGKPALWELDSDYYLHVSGTGEDLYADNCEILLKSPNWLFGQRKYEESTTTRRTSDIKIGNGRSYEDEGFDGFRELDLLSFVGDLNEEDIFQRYLAVTTVDEASGWYGGTLLGDQDENSEIYKHYAECCQCLAVDHFKDDPEIEKHYADVLQMNTIDVFDNATVEAEMEAALKGYNEIGDDLGILPVSCKSFAEDPSRLTRWIIGEERVEKL